MSHQYIQQYIWVFVTDSDNYYTVVLLTMFRFSINWIELALKTAYPLQNHIPVFHKNVLPHFKYLVSLHYILNIWWNLTYCSHILRFYSNSINLGTPQVHRKFISAYRHVFWNLCASVMMSWKVGPCTHKITRDKHKWK